MYISLWKLMYPKADEIRVRVEDVVDPTDKEEQPFVIKVLDKNILALTHDEAMVLHNELGHALEEHEENIARKIGE